MFKEIKKEYDKRYNEKLNRTGLFWAFGNNQFDENKAHKNAPANEYLSVGAGKYIHKSNKEKLDHFFEDIAPKLKSEFVSKINMDDLIKYKISILN